MRTEVGMRKFYRTGVHFRDAGEDDSTAEQSKQSDARKVEIHDCRSLKYSYRGLCMGRRSMCDCYRTRNCAANQKTDGAKILHL